MIQVFSRSANAWVDGVVVELPENIFVYAEYQIGKYWYGKTLHMSSDHLSMQSTHDDISEDDISEEELDPELAFNSSWEVCVRRKDANMPREPSRRDLHIGPSVNLEPSVLSMSLKAAFMRLGFDNRTIGALSFAEGIFDLMKDEVRVLSEWLPNVECHRAHLMHEQFCRLSETRVMQSCMHLLELGVRFCCLTDWVFQALRESGDFCDTTRSSSKAAQLASSISDFYAKKAVAALPHDWFWHDIGPQQLLLQHQLSGVIMKAIPWRPLDADGDLIILYHYTSKAAFDAINESSELWATLLESASEERRKYDVCFGDGAYATCKAPDDFGSKHAILTNNYGGVHGGTEGLADFCIPLLIPRSHAYDVMMEAVPGLTMRWNTNYDRSLEHCDCMDIEEVPHRPGFNRHGKPIRDRDIWVIPLRNGIGKVVNVADTDLMVRKLRGANSSTFQLLVQSLKNPEGRLRRQALQTLLKMTREGNQAALDFCGLEDQDPEVRKAAIREFGSMAQKGNHRALEFGQDVRKDKDPKVREAAIRLFGWMAQNGNHRAMDFVQDGLKDHNEKVREAAIWEFGMIARNGNHRALDFVQVSLKDQNPEVRDVAARCAWLSSRMASRTKVQDGLKDQYAEVRGVACLDFVGGAHSGSQRRP